MLGVTSGRGHPSAEKGRRFVLKNAKLWSGLTSLFAVILVITLIGGTLANANQAYINNTLGIDTARVVEKGEAPADTTYFKSQFGAFDDPEAQAKAIEAALEQNRNEMREGAALLLNKDGALPLTEAKKVTVLGHGAVDPAYQASSAGTKVKNGAVNSVDLKAALEGQGFEVNGTLWTGLQGGTAARGIPPSPRCSLPGAAPPSRSTAPPPARRRTVPSMSSTPTPSPTTATRPSWSSPGKAPRALTC